MVGGDVQVTVYSAATAAGRLGELIQPDASKPVKVAYGTVSSISGGTYVTLDGASESAKAICLMKCRRGDRVKVEVQGHALVVTGNATSPATDDEAAGAAQAAADQAVVRCAELSADLAKVDELVATKVDAEYLAGKYATVESLEAESAAVQGLVAQKASLADLSAATARIDALDASKADVDDLSAVELLVSGKASVSDLEAESARIDRLSADHADLEQVVAGKMDVGALDAEYLRADAANVTDAAIMRILVGSGMLKDATVQDQRVTGTLDAVQVNADSITAGTIKAARLAILGEDGLYHALNASGEAAEALQDDGNSLDGSHIQAKSVTAEKVSVSDLAAFGATIAGLVLEDGSVRSLAKQSASSAAAGLYIGGDGTFGVGDGSRYVRLVDSDGDGAPDLLEVKADAMSFSAGGAVASEEMVDDAREALTDSISDLDTAVENANASAADAQQNAVEAAQKVEQLVSSVTELEQTAQGWSFEFSTLSAALGELEGELAGDVSERSRYIRFVDGDIHLGRDDSPVNLVISNDRIGFRQNGAEVAYISDSQLFITDASVAKSLSIGKFAFRPRDNGNLSFRWVG